MRGPTITHAEAYTVLGIRPPFTEDQLKSAYRTAAKKHHPDKGGTPSAFVKVREAFELLRHEPATTKTTPPPPPPPRERPDPFAGFGGRNPFEGNFDWAGETQRFRTIFEQFYREKEHREREERYARSRYRGTGFYPPWEEDDRPPWEAQERLRQERIEAMAELIYNEKIRIGSRELDLLLTTLRDLERRRGR